MVQQVTTPGNCTTDRSKAVVLVHSLLGLVAASLWGLFYLFIYFFFWKCLVTTGCQQTFRSGDNRLSPDQKVW